MFICNVCGKTTEELTTHQEEHGLDYPPYEEMVDCCSCGGDFAESGQCKICKKWFNKNFCDFYTSVCGSCAKEYFTPERGMKYIEGREQEKEFYVECYFNSDVRHASWDLLNLCKDCFIKDLEYDPHTEDAISTLKDFVFNDIYDWCAWVEEELKKQEVKAEIERVLV